MWRKAPGPHSASPTCRPAGETMSNRRVTFFPLCDLHRAPMRRLCLRDRNRKTSNLPTSTNGVVAVAFFGMATVVRISLVVTSMTRARPHALTPRAERSFIWLKWTTPERSRHGNARGKTSTTTGKILPRLRARRVLGRNPRTNGPGRSDKSNRAGGGQTECQLW